MIFNKLTFRCILLLILIFLLISGCQQKSQPAITTIAFGSCANQDVPQPVLGIAASYKPDYFIFLGDNIYGDKLTNWEKKLENPSIDKEPSSRFFSGNI